MNVKLVKLIKDVEYKGRTYKKGSTWQIVQIDDREKIVVLINRKHLRIVADLRHTVETTFRGRRGKIAVWESKDNKGQRILLTLYIDNYGYHYETAYCWSHVCYLQQFNSTMSLIGYAKQLFLNERIETMRHNGNVLTDFMLIYINKNYVN
jgi:hypothetical protein